jgi:type II secretory pathway pseudopilin PulG
MRKNSAVSLVEMVTVLVIVVILIAVVVVWTMNSTEKAKISRALSDVHAVKSAIVTLYMDTGKFPGGCSPELLVNPDPDNYLNTVWAGLLSLPPQGLNPDNNNCGWSVSDQNNWSGPYLDEKALDDSWKGFYMYNPTYCFCRPNCPAVAPGGDYIQDCQARNSFLTSVRECINTCGPGFCTADQMMVLSLGGDQDENTCDDIIKLLTIEDFN